MSGGGMQGGNYGQPNQFWRPQQGGKIGYQSAFGSDPMANMPGRTPQAGGPQPGSMAANGAMGNAMGIDYNYNTSDPRAQIGSDAWKRAQQPQTGGGYNPMVGSQMGQVSQDPSSYAKGDPRNQLPPEAYGAANNSGNAVGNQFGQSAANPAVGNYRDPATGEWSMAKGGANPQGNAYGNYGSQPWMNNLPSWARNTNPYGARADIGSPGNQVMQRQYASWRGAPVNQGIEQMGDKPIWGNETQPWENRMTTQQGQLADSGQLMSLLRSFRGY